MIIVLEARNWAYTIPESIPEPIPEMTSDPIPELASESAPESESASESELSWESQFIPSSARASAASPSGFIRPQRGYSLARSSFDSSVPNELIVMMMARRSASNCPNGILLGDAVDEERGERRIDQHRIVQLGRCGRDVDRLHLLEAAERVALRDELRDRALVQRARDQQDDVVDHVAVRDVVQEGGQRLDRMVAHVLELDHQLLAQLVVDHGHGQRGRFVREELPIVRTLQVQLQICKTDQDHDDDGRRTNDFTHYLAAGNGVEKHLRSLLLLAALT
uniref:Uncharacterized protein n=1 Tax=Anopheles coluzzii TaxID=1518534 RepID=A0A8W7PC19_ANOCL